MTAGCGRDPGERPLLPRRPDGRKKHRLAASKDRWTTLVNHRASSACPGEPRLPRRDLGWVHRFVPADGPATLLLLHGSGGNEVSLLAFGRTVAPSANLLAVRGRSLAGGSPRFFRRDREGRPDRAELARKADALAAFARDATSHYGFASGRVTLVGHSNGANLGLASLVRRPDAFEGAALLRPMQPFGDAPLADLAGRRVVVVLGDHDARAVRGEGATPYLASLDALTLERCLVGTGSGMAMRRSARRGSGQSVCDPSTSSRNSECWMWSLLLAAKADAPVPPRGRWQPARTAQPGIGPGRLHP